MGHEEQADRMEEDADKLEQHSDQLGERIEEVESDWERKEEVASVPGAQPDPDAAGADEWGVTSERGPVPRPDQGWLPGAVRRRVAASVPQPAVAERRAGDGPVDRRRA